MRIGIDTRLWNETGVGRYIRNLIYELQIIDKQNEYVLFVMDRDYNDVKFRISNLKFKISNCNIRWHTIEEQIVFPQILNKYNLDLVHFPYYSVPIFYNKPFVVTIHDLIPLHQKTGQASTLPLPLYKLKLLAFKFVVSQAASKAKKIIAPSNATKQDIAKYLEIPSRKIEVVYEGVDDNLRNEGNSKSNLLLYVGNAYPHKNLSTLLKAVKVAKNEIPDLSLVLVGKEDYFYKKLKKVAKSLNLENVTFYGFAKDAQLRSFYKRAKAIVIPSFIEGFGLPALEAMANGTIVLASDISSLHEVGGEAAVYFDPKNTDDLVHKLREVYSNTALYHGNIEKGLERVKIFTWRKTAEQTLKLYESSASSDSW